MNCNEEVEEEENLKAPMWTIRQLSNTQPLCFGGMKPNCYSVLRSAAAVHRCHVYLQTAPS
jgi:hypothetical protein